MQNIQNKITVIKIGGSTLGQHDTTLEDVVALQKRGVPLVVVHGGGKIITEWLGKLGASSQFVQGERVTDKVGLEVVSAVLSGLVNKDLVGSLIRLGAKAVGLSGADGSLLQAKIKDPALGYTGLISRVDSSILELHLKAGYVPVISPVSLNSDGGDGLSPVLLNVNADSAAGEIAAALGADKLIFLTDVAGVSDKAGRLISELNVEQAEAALASGVASGGMIPKLRAAIRALSSARSIRIIDGRQSHALIHEFERGQGGTTLLAHK